MAVNGQINVTSHHEILAVYHASVCRNLHSLLKLGFWNIVPPRGIASYSSWQA